MQEMFLDVQSESETKSGETGADDGDGLGG